MVKFVLFGVVVLLAAAPMRPAAGQGEPASKNRERTPLTLHRYESVEPHMGTLVRITLYAAGEDEARGAFDAAFARIRALDQTFSDYKPDSELNQLTTRPAGTAAGVSEDLFRVLSASQELAVATSGAFDVTLGPVIRLWREARAAGRLPEDQALRDATARSGFRKLVVEPRTRTVILAAAGMTLDVGAVGKGYAASEALEVLRARGVRSALVAVSGDLAFGDPPPGKAGWRIAMHELPPSEAQGVPAVLELTNAAVSTAGAAEQHADIAGRRYSHIVDPATGIGLTDDVTVTVIASHGLEADGLDTAASVLGVERGMALIESHPDAAGLIVRRTPQGITLLPSSRLRTLIASRQKTVPE
jgi:thiamine biosynthesis lipoprotein